MSLNERVQWESGDIVWDQLSPSQAARTDYTPGVPPSSTSARADAMNWPRDFNIPTGCPAFDRGTTCKSIRTIVVKLGRNIICDQTILPPIALTPVANTITDHATWGLTNPEYTITPTVTQNDNGNQERRTGSNTIEPV